MRLTDEIEDFLEDAACEGRLSARTLTAYRSDLFDFARSVGDVTRANEVGEQSIRGYIREMRKERRLSPATVARRVASLRKFFRYVARRKLYEDPFTNWDAKIHQPKRLPRPLQRSELRALIFAAALREGASNEDRSLMHLAILIMASTGLRIGELCGIRLADVEDDGASIRVRGKGARERQVYVTSPMLVASLQALVRARAAVADLHAPLFSRVRDGRALNAQSVRRRLRLLGQEAGIGRRVTPHMLRHTAATLLLEAGVDIRYIQKLLGHASISTTVLYTAATDEHLRRALRAADVLQGVVPVDRRVWPAL